jgi:hypothetical protein
VLSDQRANGVRAGVAELCDEHKVKQVVMAFYVREEVYFLNEVQEPWDIHETEKRGRDGEDTGGVAL